MYSVVGILIVGIVLAVILYSSTHRPPGRPFMGPTMPNADYPADDALARAAYFVATDTTQTRPIIPHGNSISTVERSDSRSDAYTDSPTDSRADFGIPTATQPGWQQWAPAPPARVTDPYSAETDVGEKRDYAPGGIVDEQYLPAYYPEHVWQTATPNNVFDKRAENYLLSGWRLNLLNEQGRPAVPMSDRPAGYTDKKFSGYYGAVLMNVVRDSDYEFPEKIRPGFNMRNSMTYWMSTDSPIAAAFWPNNGPAIYPGGD